MRGAVAKLSAAVAVGFWLAPAFARASTGYPAEIQTQLNLSKPPACSICHAGGDTDAGTVTTPFGTTMVMFGLMGGNNLSSVDGALAGLEGTNSPYIAYLKANEDPNNPQKAPGITYGCWVVPAERPTAGVGGLLFLGLMLLVLLRARPRPSAEKDGSQA
jgi:hypothetical protein